MSTASHGGSGSATITFRKLIDSGVLHTEALNEILSYPIDVDWVDAYMSKKRCARGGCTAGLSV